MAYGANHPKGLRARIAEQPSSRHNQPGHQVVQSTARDKPEGQISHGCNRQPEDASYPSRCNTSLSVRNWEPSLRALALVLPRAEKTTEIQKVGFCMAACMTRGAESITITVRAKRTTPSSLSM